MSDNYDYDDDVPEGCVYCSRCNGFGTVPDFENWDNEYCPVCDGEGYITRELSDKMNASREKFRDILAEALAENSMGRGSGNEQAA
jgi:RecJ-like exonuclease